MQIRCSQCHRPFAMGKDAVFAALDEMVSEDLSHYNVHCPHCGKSNQISKDQLVRSAPDWKGSEKSAQANT